jgi:hypothetical protein
MADILAKLAGVKFADVKQQPETDASDHGEQGMYLEHLWRKLVGKTRMLYCLK